MVSLKLQKRLASKVLKCGKKRVWMDPNEINELALANSRNSVRKAVKDGLILKKPVKVHSRWRVRRRNEAKAKGRRSGLGHRKGTKKARTSPQLMWMKRLRVLRRLLKRYREQKKIDKHLYHDLYMKAKGNQFKNKRVLMETIHKEKTDRSRNKTIEDQAAVLRKKNKALRDKRADKQGQRLKERAVGDAPEAQP
eukprot:TRINITY_DN621_c0_g1_i1.p1 TRINITY_DN621_c0_g1~~TRINITY_DN621_c0_g1_i1.p1  ORF type:complete len:195 (+),score=44.11 TRINITY_DN621_c0_g1_i1:46-630(+)